MAHVIDCSRQVAGESCAPRHFIKLCFALFCVRYFRARAQAITKQVAIQSATLKKFNACEVKPDRQAFPSALPLFLLQSLTFVGKIFIHSESDGISPSAI